MLSVTKNTTSTISKFKVWPPQLLLHPSMVYVAAQVQNPCLLRVELGLFEELSKSTLTFEVCMLQMCYICVITATIADQNNEFLLWVHFLFGILVV